MARLRDHVACSSGDGVRNRCSCVTRVNSKAATYRTISTAATVPLTTSRWMNVSVFCECANSAGMRSAVTARTSEVACTDAARAL